MAARNFDKIVEEIIKKDIRYPRGAYHFIREALEHTVKNLDATDPQNLHVTGKVLLNGIRDYALIQYGPMTMTLLKQWRVESCEDFGNIVFNLVEAGVFGKTDNDNRADFENGFDFHEAFEKPFLP